MINYAAAPVVATNGCFRSDELAFDETNQVVLVGNPAETNIGKSVSVPFITLIDARPVAAGTHHPILTKISFDGTNGTPDATNGIEQSVWDPGTGNFYLSIPQDGPNATVGAVFVVNGGLARLGDNPIIRKFTVNNCTPNGAALGPNHELILGCSAGPVQILDIRDGSVQATYPQVTGCDEVASTGLTAGIFVGACNGDAQIINSQTLQFYTAIPLGGRGDHSATVDPVSGEVLAPVEANSTVPGICGSGQAAGCIAVIAPAVTQANVTPLTMTTSSSSITLNASASTTATPGTISYLFSVVPGSKVPAIVQSPNSPMATVEFVNGPGTYQLELTVTDGNGGTSTSPVITLIHQPSGTGTGTTDASPITISVTGPAGSTSTTSAHNTFTTATGQLTLNATGSTSTNTGALTYSLVPANGASETVSIQATSSGIFSIEMPRPGTYTFTLTVTDSTKASNTATTTVNYI